MIKRISCILLICFNTVAFAQKNIVTISGKVTDNSKKVYLTDNSSVGFLIGKKTPIETNEKDEFSITLPLEKPQYFRLGRNLLYLSPGDQLTCLLDMNNYKSSTFKGIGASVNNYFLMLPNAQAGSFIENGKLMEGLTASKFLDTLTAISKKYKAMLDTIKQVSPTFVLAEKKRIDFEILNSLMSYEYFYREMNSSKEDKIIQRHIFFADSIFKPTILKCLSDLNHQEFLDIDIFRDFLPQIADTAFMEKYSMAPFTMEIQDYNTTLTLIDLLRSQGANSEVVNMLDSTMKVMSNKTYINILKDKYTEYSNLLPGKPLIDFTMTDKDGKTYPLSQFKGKMILIDVWATWCGPCKQEMPYFDSLKTKIGEDNMHFISVSTDKNKNLWISFNTKHDKKGIQLHYDGDVLREAYKLYYIPRFILIDAEGNFIDAFAARPSDPKLEEMIRKYIKK